MVKQFKFGSVKIKKDLNESKSDYFKRVLANNNHMFQTGKTITAYELCHMFDKDLVPADSTPMAYNKHNMLKLDLYATANSLLKNFGVVLKACDYYSYFLVQSSRQQVNRKANRCRKIAKNKIDYSSNLVNGYMDYGGKFTKDEMENLKTQAHTFNVG